MSKIQKMLNTMPQIGTVEWIGLRPGKRDKIQSVDSAEITIEDGIIGDHYSRQHGDRQVTLIQAEHLDGVARILGTETITVEQTRRNILVSGINLLALKDRQFRIGDTVVLEMTGHCHPCSRMEENLGAGGYNAMRGHGGINARVISGGLIHFGDQIRLIPGNDLSPDKETE